MFEMWGLWRLIKTPLRNVLGNRFGLLKNEFWAILSSSVDDLTSTVTQEYFATDIWRHTAKVVVFKRGSDNYADRLLEAKAFPLDALESSQKLRDSIAKKLSSNIRLAALRTKAGIDDVAWETMLGDYSQSFVKAALPYAITRMIENEIPLNGQDFPIDLARREPSRIAGAAGYNDLVIFYGKRLADNGLRQAKKIWKSRNGSSVSYRIDEYDGFQAS